MSEEQETPVEQTSSGQQVDWQARYTGQQAKLQQLSETNKLLTEQLANANAKIAELTAQGGVKEAEHTTAVGQKEQTIQSLTQENQALKAENATLKASQAKLAAIRKLNRPDLLMVMDAVPASEDPAALETAFSAMAGYADQLVQQREQQLKAGITPAGSGGAQTAAQPATTKGWEEHVNSLSLGTPERAKAMDDWGKWARTHPNE